MKSVNKVVLVASLGYFVDIIDLFLFNILRIPSLRSIGVAEDSLFSSGIFILNCQMIGMLIGSFVWGVLGDKKGRVSVLYGSIFLYSLATLANAFVTSVNMYAVLRFVAGFGLSGELGAAITLVSESMDKKNRGWGTTIVGGVGLFGGVVASCMAEFMSWKSCYIAGGILGFMLLFLRLGLKDSEIFRKIESNQERGSLFLLFRSPKRIGRILCLIANGMPIYFVAGVLMVFAPEFAKLLGVTGGTVTAGRAILFSYIGVAIGDFLSGFLSQWTKNRKRTLAMCLVAAAIGIVGYLEAVNVSIDLFYLICFLIGVTTGYWAVVLTVAAEVFGTNLRSTVTTIVPNLIRSSVVLMTLTYQFGAPKIGPLNTAISIGLGVVVLALVGLYFLPETFGKDLEFVET